MFGQSTRIFQHTNSSLQRGLKGSRCCVTAWTHLWAHRPTAAIVFSLSVFGALRRQCSTSQADTSHPAARGQHWEGFVNCNKYCLAAAVLDVKHDYRVVLAGSPPAGGTPAPETAAPCGRRPRRHETAPAQQTPPQARMLRLRRARSPRSTIPGVAAQLLSLHDTGLSAQRSREHFVPCSWRCSGAAIKQLALITDPSQHWQTAAINHTLTALTPMQLAIWHLMGKRRASRGWHTLVLQNAMAAPHVLWPGPVLRPHAQQMWQLAVRWVNVCPWPQVPCRAQCRLQNRLGVGIVLQSLLQTWTHSLARILRYASPAVLTTATAAATVATLRLCQALGDVYG